MNLIKSVNIQMKNDSELMLSFSQPKTNKDAIEQAKCAIEIDCGQNVIELWRNIAEPNSWIAMNNFEPLAWITLNKVTVKG